MSNPSDRARRLLPTLALAASTALALSCAARPPVETAAPPASSSAAAPEATPAPPAVTAAAAQPAAGQARLPEGFDFPSEPADGRWLVDDQQRRYFEHRVKKIEGTYFLNAEQTSVKFWLTPPFQLLRQDAEYFYVKVYGVDAPAPTVAAQAPSGVDQGAASYTVSTPASDRLRFEPWATGLPTRGQWRQGFDLADVNADGHLDIVHGPPRKGGSAPAIFLGDGKGNWRRWGGLQLPDRALDYGDAASADFNGDGNADLAFASHLRGLSVMLGDGEGRFTLWSEGLDYRLSAGSAEGGDFSSRAIEVVDWNRDGRPDLVALSEGPTLDPSRSSSSATYLRGARGIAIYLNQGDGTWRRQTVAGRSFGDSLVVAQLAGDGQLDMVTASASTGDQGLLYVGQSDGSALETPLTGVRPRSIYRAVAGGDFDGDGRQDLALGYISSELGSWRTGVDVLLARPGDSWERRPVGVAESQAGIWAVDAGDLDGDGRLDLLAATGQGELWVFLGDGSGGFTAETSPELAIAELAGCTGYHARLEDADGDGAAELVVGFAGEGGAIGEALSGQAVGCPTGGSLRAWKVAPSRGAEPRPAGARSSR
jgi:hypothetical protein